VKKAKVPVRELMIKLNTLEKFYLIYFFVTEYCINNKETRKAITLKSIKTINRIATIILIKKIKNHAKIINKNSENIMYSTLRLLRLK